MNNEKWQLGTNFPFFVSLHAVAWWHQEHTLVIYCFCGISTMHVPHRRNTGWDYRHTQACAWEPTSTSVMQFPTVLWTKRFTLQAWIFFCLFYLNILKGGGYQAWQVIPTYKYVWLLPSGVSVSLLPGLGKAGHRSSDPLLFREKRTASHTWTIYKCNTPSTDAKENPTTTIFLVIWTVSLIGYIPSRNALIHVRYSEAHE